MAPVLRPSIYRTMNHSFLNGAGVPLVFSFIIYAEEVELGFCGPTCCRRAKSPTNGGV